MLKTHNFLFKKEIATPIFQFVRKYFSLINVGVFVLQALSLMFLNIVAMLEGNILSPLIYSIQKHPYAVSFIKCCIYSLENSSILQIEFNFIFKVNENSSCIFHIKI